jgi:hypothetical protein
MDACWIVGGKYPVLIKNASSLNCLLYRLFFGAGDLFEHFKSLRTLPSLEELEEGAHKLYGHYSNPRAYDINASPIGPPRTANSIPEGSP